MGTLNLPQCDNSAPNYCVPEHYEIHNFIIFLLLFLYECVCLCCLHVYTLLTKWRHSPKPSWNKVHATFKRSHVPPPPPHPDTHVYWLGLIPVAPKNKSKSHLFNLNQCCCHHAVVCTHRPLFCLLVFDLLRPSWLELRSLGLSQI